GFDAPRIRTCAKLVDLLAFCPHRANDSRTEWYRNRKPKKRSGFGTLSNLVRISDGEHKLKRKVLQARRSAAKSIEKQADASSRRSLPTPSHSCRKTSRV